jgi:hypothetical protein
MMAVENGQWISLSGGEADLIKEDGDGGTTEMSAWVLWMG